MPDLDKLHRQSSHHRAAVKESPLCGCFYCEQTFPGAEVGEWWDYGHTAVCPRCGIDAVLPATIDAPTLKAMRERFFSDTDIHGNQFSGNSIT